jgi:hypothetical protein
MNETLQLILRILGLATAAAGMLVVYLAPRIVDKRGLAGKKTLDPTLVEHMTPEEKDKLRRDSAIVDVKLRGALIAAPGLVLILIAFR